MEPHPNYNPQLKLKQVASIFENSRSIEEHNDDYTQEVNERIGPNMCPYFNYAQAVNNTLSVILVLPIQYLNNSKNYEFSMLDFNFEDEQLYEVSGIPDNLQVVQESKTFENISTNLSILNGSLN
uniref:Uncharacterized protein n=1 Tax=Heterorhabditis bacteriophora TaxID=37862 RepID=A0A1I7XQX5_HETBA